MEDTLISFETAKLAKEKGFNDSKSLELPNGKKFSMTRCCSYSDDDRSTKHRKFYSKNNPHYLAPTQSLLQKWLREEHDIHMDISFAVKDGRPYFEFNGYGVNVSRLKDDSSRSSGIHPTYEQALEIGLQEALKLIK